MLVTSYQADGGEGRPSLRLHFKKLRAHRLMQVQASDFRVVQFSAALRDHPEPRSRKSLGFAEEPPKRKEYIVYDI